MVDVEQSQINDTLLLANDRVAGSPGLDNNAELAPNEQIGTNEHARYTNYALIS